MQIAARTPTTSPAIAPPPKLGDREAGELPWPDIEVLLDGVTADMIDEAVVVPFVGVAELVVDNEVRV